MDLIISETKMIAWASQVGILIIEIENAYFYKNIHRTYLVQQFIRQKTSFENERSYNLIYVWFWFHINYHSLILFLCSVLCFLLVIVIAIFSTARYFGMRV